MELDTVVCGDCLDVMADMPDNVVDTVLTDPPYGLSKEPDMAEVLSHWLAGDDYEHRGGGFMGRSWDSFTPGPSVWREVYRVMKPGGTLLAFGGTRTNDLLSIAIRLAGFRKFDEIDYYYGGGLPPQCSWVNGQGFPKSLNISVAVDKHLGKVAEREINGTYVRPDGKPRNYRQWEVDGGYEGGWNVQNRQTTSPATEAAAQWSGYGTGLKPAHEVILCFYKPCDGTYAHNALAWSVAGLWIDGGRIATGDYLGRPVGHGGIIYGNGKGYTADMTESTPHNPQGRWPANLILSHVPSSLCPDCDGDGCDICGGAGEVGGCKRVGMKMVRGSHPIGPNPGRAIFGGINGSKGKPGEGFDYADPDGYERVDDWICQPGCPVAALAAQSGERPHSWRSDEPKYYDSEGQEWFGLGNRRNVGYKDSGSAARFFYQSKASSRERNLGCQDVYWRKDKGAPIGFVRIGQDEWETLPERERARGNIHPTIKPLGIVEYLCTLTKTPMGGIVFDPFCGTGTTALAAIKTGRRWLCCDNQPDYVYLANLRVEALRREMAQMELAL
jgi:DNA modification methylase